MKARKLMRPGKAEEAPGQDLDAILLLKKLKRELEELRRKVEKL